MSLIYIENENNLTNATCTLFYSLAEIEDKDKYMHSIIFNIATQKKTKIIHPILKINLPEFGSNRGADIIYPDLHLKKCKFIAISN